MLRIAILTGALSCLLFFAGLFGLLTRPVIGILVVTFVILSPFLFKDKLSLARRGLSLNPFDKLVISALAALFLINLIGVFGPEYSFDSLWYHLTIPKLFLDNGRVFFIEGSLFYYSLLPKLTEMLYLIPLSFWDETGAKLIHYLFGIGTAVWVFKIARIYLSRSFSLLSALVFYSNLVVMWLSITSYVDLARAFFEAGALFYLVLYLKTKSNINIFKSALLLGLAISVKLVSLITLPVIVAVLIFKISGNFRERIIYIMLYLSTALLIPLPYFIYSYFQSGNPFFPLFSNHAPEVLNFTNLFPNEIIKNLIATFLFSSDPISPVYLIALPLMILFFSKMKNHVLIVYSLLTLLFWYFASFSGIWHATDQAGSARFLTSYLPSYSVLVVIFLTLLKSRTIKNFAIIMVFVIVIINAGYRLLANSKYIPVILGSESKENFLMENLNFAFGDFYDEDGKIGQIVGNEKVLLLNMHNLYYVNFPYTLDRWDDQNEASFVLVQDGVLPEGFKNSELIYENPRTYVKLYKL